MSKIDHRPRLHNIMFDKIRIINKPGQMLGNRGRLQNYGTQIGHSLTSTGSSSTAQFCLGAQ